MYKFIIWGTGNTAKSFVMQHYNGFFRHNTITAFVHNSYWKKQKTFFDIPIISPDEITHYDIDFILIASIYDEEITKQIVDELHYDEKKILHMCDIYRFMYDYWENSLNLSSKKILCVGASYFGIDNQFYNKKCLKMVGYVESSSLNNIYDYNYDYIFLSPQDYNKI